MCVWFLVLGLFCFFAFYFTVLFSSFWCTCFLLALLSCLFLFVSRCFYFISCFIPYLLLFDPLVFFLFSYFPPYSLCLAIVYTLLLPFTSHTCSSSPSYRLFIALIGLVRLVLVILVLSQSPGAWWRSCERLRLLIQCSSPCGLIRVPGGTGLPIGQAFVCSCVFLIAVLGGSTVHM